MKLYIPHSISILKNINHVIIVGIQYVCCMFNKAQQAICYIHISHTYFHVKCGSYSGSLITFKDTVIFTYISNSKTSLGIQKKNLQALNFSDFFFNSPLQLLLQNERETLFLPAHKSSPPTRLKYLKIISKFDEIYSKALGFFQGNVFINTFKIDIFEVLRTDTFMVCIYSYAGAP